MSPTRLDRRSDPVYFTFAVRPPVLRVFLVWLYGTKVHVRLQSTGKQAWNGSRVDLPGLGYLDNRLTE